MAKDIKLAEKYVNDPENWNALYKETALTGLLETERIKFLDANTIKVPRRKFNTDEIGDYSRADGTTGIELIEEWDTYTLSEDKGEHFYLDEQDDEETLGDGIMKRANARTRENIVPYIDRYRFSKINTTPTATVVGAKIVEGEASTVDNAIELIDDAYEYLETNEVSTTNTILYVSPAFRKKMQRSKDIQKNFGVRDMAVGGVNTQFDIYNNSAIITVTPDRLGKDVEFILINPFGVTTTVKFNESKLVDATATTHNLFGYYWKYRFYHDLFISKGQAIEEGGVLVNPAIYIKKISE